MEQSPPAELLSAEMFAAIFGLSVGLVRRLIREHRIAALTHPHIESVRIPIAEVERFRAEWTAVNGPIRPGRRGAGRRHREQK